MNKKLPSPADHPNAYAGISVGAVASLLVYEAKNRLGIDLTIEEAGMLVSSVIAVWLFFGKVSRKS